MAELSSHLLSRLQRAGEAMRAGHIDAMLLTPGADLFYLTGFEHGHAGERLLALVLRADGEAQWIVPAMNVPQVEERSLAGQSIRAWTDDEGYGPALMNAMAGAGEFAFDDEGRAAFLLDLLAAAPTARVRKASDVMRRLRMRKDAAELEALRSAGRVVDETIDEAMSFCRAGRTEADVDADLRGALLRRSPESTVAFTLVAAGPNSALPHPEISRRKITAGDVVVLDYGTRGAAGYQSDITVTCAVGEPNDPETRAVYSVVHAAQQAALAVIRPGVSCQEVDRAARAVIESAGYGQYFLHRTGHGLGLQVHEPPFLVAGNAEPLEEGMVFSIEPGIYHPDRFGIRLEVIAAVTADGASLINAPSAPELPVVRG